jgi:hypothetical protein
LGAEKTAERPLHIGVPFDGFALGPCMALRIAWSRYGSVDGSVGESESMCGGKSKACQDRRSLFASLFESNNMIALQYDRLAVACELWVLFIFDRLLAIIGHYDMAVSLSRPTRAICHCTGAFSGLALIRPSF